MKKIYRASQRKHVIGPRIGGLQMHKYGLPYDGAAGHFFPNKTDHIDLMLAAVARHPEIHVVTFFKCGGAVNRYEPKNADVYYLF